MTIFAGRDGPMRGNLEAHLMFAPPSELLIGQPISSPTRRLLGSFTQSVQGLKAESVDGHKYSAETAEATIQAFYASGIPFMLSKDIQIFKFHMSDSR
jgi:hypothetical protein